MKATIGPSGHPLHWMEVAPILGFVSAIAFAFGYYRAMSDAYDLCVSMEGKSRAHDCALGNASLHNVGHGGSELSRWWKP